MNFTSSPTRNPLTSIQFSSSSSFHPSTSKTTYHLKSKLLLLKHLQKTRERNQEKIEYAKREKFMEVMLPKFQQKLNITYKTRIGKSATNLLPIIIQKWYKYAIPLIQYA